MTTEKPAHTADWHAATAESLADLARSASMAGWFNRHRRADMLARAQVHATLGAVAMVVDNPVAAAAVERLTNQLASTEAARDIAVAHGRQLEDELEQIQRTLHNYGVPDVAVLDVAEATRTLLDDRMVFRMTDGETA